MKVTLQIYIVCKSRVKVSHRHMEIFLILKRLGDNLTRVVKNISAKETVNSWFL